jgi:hypothetical protein
MEGANKSGAQRVKSISDVRVKTGSGTGDRIEGFQESDRLD